MQTITSIWISIIIAVCVSYSAYSGGRALAQGDWVQPVANRSLPSVVTVLSFDGDGKQFGIGSGFIVREDGLVVTCYHVIKNASAVEVGNKEIGSYRVKGVVAVEEDDFTILQTSAPIYPGNSGGPLLNKHGEVIGIVAARVDDGPTLGLAVPINYVRKALRDNISLKYSIRDMARLEERISREEEEQKLAKVIRENFTRYEDPGGFFSLAVPKKWQAQRDEYWTDDCSTFVRTTVIAPEDARLAQVSGYVSEGLRITFQSPPKGKVWTRQGIEQWKDSVAQNMVKANPGFALTDSGTMKFGGTVAQFYTFVGQDRRLPEPEKTVMFVMANSEALVMVEVIAPTSKLDMLDVMQIISAATFELDLE